jgi:hypothetical protein
MTPITNSTEATRTAPAAEQTLAPMTREEVKKMLRDAAFVLRMTARVKAEIVAARPETAKGGPRTAPELPAGLGV